MPPHGLDPQELAPEEVVLHHWSGPRGIGLLTRDRVLLLGHPHPIHRSIEWSARLVSIGSVEVVQLGSGPGGPIASSLGGTTLRQDPVPGAYSLRLDGVEVLRGVPRDCERVRGWITEARRGSMDRSRGAAGRSAAGTRRD